MKYKVLKEVNIGGTVIKPGSTIEVISESVSGPVKIIIADYMSRQDEYVVIDDDGKKYTMSGSISMGELNQAYSLSHKLVEIQNFTMFVSFIFETNKWIVELDGLSLLSGSINKSDPLSCLDKIKTWWNSLIRLV